MAVNPSILSEITHNNKLDDVSRDLLMWAVSFEESNIEMELPRFKKEYASKLDSLLSDDSLQNWTR